MDERAFPGPPALGRGVVVEPGATLPGPAADWPRLRIDTEALADPAKAVEELHTAWRERQATVVELAVPFAELKQPETTNQAPYSLDPGFAFARERLHFLVWANRYDARSGTPVWHHARRAARLGAEELADGPSAEGEVRLPDGTACWIDGGPRTSGLVDQPVLHMHQLEAGSLQADRPAEPGDSLAPDQLAAVRHRGGPARILAPAGSGKTRVLTARLRHLLADRGWAPEAVTALAYNTRAAEEMRSRTGDLPRAQIRTLHALGFEILGRARGGRPRLLDEREVRDLLEQLLPVRHRANEDVLAPYLEALGQVRGGLWTPIDVEADRDDVPGFADAFDHYRDELARRGAIDFDEQIYGAVEALLRDPVTRQWAQQRCRHLLVDELQDLTPAQLLLVRLLAAPAYDVFGVGDDDQVIYGYAGADPRFLIDYDQFFPGAASYLLEVNYRCPPAVVTAAATLLTYNHQRVPKEIRAGSPDDGTAGLRVETHSEAAVGARLVAVVEELVDKADSPDDVAVLTRVNAGLLAPQILLGEAGVPLRGAVDERMLERTGMRAALAWLRLGLAASENRPLNGADLAVVARRPSRSLSPGVLKALGRGDWALGRLDSWAGDIDDARLRNGLTGLHDDLALLAQHVRNGARTADLLVEVRETIGLGRALGRLDGARAASAGGHIDDLDALTLVARAHPDPGDFDTWLRRRLRARPAADAVGVTLSTVHRVKGLEWPHVVVWDATDGIMPHRLSEPAGGEEEERRVFHVALTRAQRSATVLGRSGTPSPFLAELDGSAEHTPPPPPRELVVSAGREPRRRAAPATAAAAAPALEGDAARLSEALREWRRQRAKADGVPAYVVLHDRHLDGVAARAPRSLDDLAHCDGIGPTKLDRYGDVILAVVDAVLPSG